MSNLDTRQKRASALVALRPYVVAPPLPDGTIDQGDRQHAAFMYGGILATAAPLPPPNLTAGIWPQGAPRAEGGRLAGRPGPGGRRRP